MSTRTSRRSSSSESHGSIASFLDKVPRDSPSPSKSASPSKRHQLRASPTKSPLQQTLSSGSQSSTQKTSPSPKGGPSNYLRRGYTLGGQKRGQGSKPFLTRQPSFEKSDDQQPLTLGGSLRESNKPSSSHLEDPFAGSSSPGIQLRKTRPDIPYPYATVGSPRPHARPHIGSRAEASGRSLPRRLAVSDDMSHPPHSRFFQHVNDRLQTAQEHAILANKEAAGDASIQSLVKFNSKDEDEFFNLIELATYSALDKQEMARYQRVQRERRVIESRKFYIFGMTMGEWYWELMEIVWRLILFAFSCWLFYAGWTVLTLHDGDDLGVSSPTRNTTPHQAPRRYR